MFTPRYRLDRALLGIPQRGQDYLREILEVLAGLYGGSLFLSNLHKFLDLKRKIVDLLHSRSVPHRNANRCRVRPYYEFSVPNRYRTGYLRISP